MGMEGGGGDFFRMVCCSDDGGSSGRPCDAASEALLDRSVLQHS